MTARERFMRKNILGRINIIFLTIMVFFVMTVCGCEKEDRHLQVTFPIIQGAEEVDGEIEELATFVPEYKYSEGYEDVTSIINEDFEEYVKLYTLDKILSDFNGAVLIALDDTIIYANGFGYADEDADIKNDIHTTFEIGEIAMGFTAEAIYNLCADELLDLDTTIDKFFPNFKEGKKITVENLLTYSSGLPSYFTETDKFSNGDELQELIASVMDEGCNLPKNFLIDYLTDIELVFEPGESLRKNDTDYYLLGIIIELVSGMSYEDYVYSQVLVKNGMIMSNVAYEGASAKPISDLDYICRYHSNVARGYSTGNSNVIEMYQWLRHIYCDVLYDYGAMLRMGMTGYSVRESSTDGYYFVSGAVPVIEFDENNLSQIDMRKNVIYIICATNDTDDVEQFVNYFNNVYSMVTMLQEKLAKEIQ